MCNNGTNLGKKQSERFQDGNFDLPGESVPKDTDQRSSDVDHRGFERFCTGDID